MNTEEERKRIKEELAKAGCEWAIASWGREADKELDKIRKSLRDFAERYQELFPGPAPDVYAFAKANPLKASAFFQLDTLRTSPQMKVMIWRVFLGAEIVRVEFSYSLGKKPKLFVTLRTPYGEEENYMGEHVWDYHVLRHFGVADSDQGMVLHGFYPLG